MDDDLKTRMMPEGTDPEGTVLVGMPMTRAMDMRLMSSRPDEALLRLPYSEKLVGDRETGVLAGGAVTTLLDTACGTAVMMSRKKPSSTATLDLRIDYMRPATRGRDVYAHAECYRATRTVGFVRATAFHDSADDPIAMATAAFILEFPEPKAGS